MDLYVSTGGRGRSILKHWTRTKRSVNCFISVIIGAKLLCEWITSVISASLTAIEHMFILDQVGKSQSKAFLLMCCLSKLLASVALLQAYVAISPHPLSSTSDL